MIAYLSVDLRIIYASEGWESVYEMRVRARTKVG